MIISPDGTLAAIIREGDYVVFKTHPGLTPEAAMTSVDFSPSADAKAPVLGGFASRKGKTLYIGAEEAAQLLEDHSLRAEQRLVDMLSGAPDARRGKSLSERLLGLLQAHGESGQAGKRWDGTMGDLHREIIHPVLGIPYDATCIMAIKRLVNQTDGIDWEDVLLGEPAPLPRLRAKNMKALKADRRLIIFWGKLPKM